MQSKHGDAPDEQLPDNLVDATLFSSWKSLRGMDKPMAVELWLRESAKEQGLTDDTISNNVDEAKTAAETNAAAEANIAAEANAIHNVETRIGEVQAAAKVKIAAEAKAAVETNDVADAKPAAEFKVDDSSNDASFCSLRAQHESILRRLSPSPLPADATHAGNIHNGYGIKLLKDGAIYAGDFADGVRSGHGVQRWLDGDFYVGEWREDARDGYGSYRFSHGDEDLSCAIEDSECDRYDGEWKDNHFQGKGWCRSAA